MRVAAYARYSTAEQDKISIAAQLANVEALCGREGFTIVARFQDEARQGSDDRRPGYRAMLAALERGDFDGIAADETSRITRNQSELHRLVAELRYREQFLATADGIDTRSETSEIVLSVRAAIDSMESKRIGYRVFRSNKERHKNGYASGGRTFGYSSVADGDYRRRVVNDTEAVIVREIFERYGAGESTKAIAHDLNRRGVPSPGASWKRTDRVPGWTHTTICGAATKQDGIVRNSTYVGRVAWNKRAGKRVPGTGRRVQRKRAQSEWIVREDETLRIVSDDLWTRVQARLIARKAQQPKGGKPARYMLSGLLKCACCGSSYSMRNDRNYGCAGYVRGLDCTQGRVLSRRKAETELLAGIKAKVQSPEYIKAMAVAVRSRLRALDQGADKKAIAAEHAKVDRELGNAVDALVSLGKSAAVLARVRELEARKASLEGQIRAIDKPPRIVPNVERMIVARIERLEDAARDPDKGDRVRVEAQDLIGSVRVIEEGEHIIGEIDGGRFLILGGSPDVTNGAQETAPQLHPLRVVLV
jgi:site-specific DNA recombinase